MDDLVVRTVTVFIPTTHCTPERTFHASILSATTLAHRTRDALQSAGITVQTTRLATPGPAAFGTPMAALRAAVALDDADTDFASLGTVRASDAVDFRATSFALDVLKTTKTVFLTHTVAEDGSISGDLAHGAASVTVEAASLEEHGMANMRFAALAHVRPGCPFFPAAYAAAQAKGGLDVALGVQTAVGDAGERTLGDDVEKAAQRLQDACKWVCEPKFDFSLAPFPGEKWSVARAVMRNSRGAAFGAPGTVAGAAALASALDMAKFPRAGFCGLMLAVAEDNFLARCVRGLRLNDLLLASCVCGVGLDAVPVPGDTSVDALRRVVLDVAGLSTRLAGKQLTVRMLPQPGLNAGEQTKFDWPFLVNGKVVAVEDEGESGAVGDADEEEGDLVVRPLVCIG